jgi:hypothetical protein
LDSGPEVIDVATGATRAGRIIGVLTLAQMLGSGLVNFALAAPLFGPPGYLVNAAPHSLQIAVSVLFGLATGALPVAIAITAFPIFRLYTNALALWFVALTSVGLAIATLEQINVMSMLSLSEAYTAAGLAEREPFQGLRLVVASARNWSHFIGLIAHGSALFILYTVLYRFALVPRALAAFGLAAVLLQLWAVAMPLFGYAIIFVMLAPLGVSQLLLALWLIAKGFRAPETPSAATRVGTPAEASPLDGRA